MRSKVLRLSAVVFIGIFLITGCGRTAGNNRELPGFQIVTSFYPVYIATINITRNIPGVAVQNMTKPQTGCLHDYSLKPDDLKTIEQADVFIINGAGMEAFLDSVIERQKNLKIIEASRNIKLLKDSGGNDNPHVWVGISNAAAYVNNIAEQLAAIDGTNAEKYRENAAIYVQRLELLKSEMHSAIDVLRHRDVITFHEAFPYFAQEFNLRIAEVVEREPGSDPTPREMGGIIDLVKTTGIKALFAEPQYSSKAADVIARETGAKVYTLDPVVTGEIGPDSYDAYIRAMESNKQSLVEALK